MNNDNIKAGNQLPPQDALCLAHLVSCARLLPRLAPAERSTERDTSVARFFLIGNPHPWLIVIHDSPIETRNLVSPSSFLISADRGV